MKKFELSRQPQLRGDTLTRFHVLDSAGSTVGIISVPTLQADDLQRHWLDGATQSSASAPTRAGGALAAALEANKRPGSLPPALASKPNPAVNAMLAAAKKNRLTKEAVLRGC